MQAKVNGTLIIFNPAPLTISSLWINIYSANCDELKYISMRFPIRIGTYSFPSENSNTFANLHYEGKQFPCAIEGGAAICRAIEGSVNLTENSEERVKGTFSFICTIGNGETMTVSEGVFDIKKSKDE